MIFQNDRATPMSAAIIVDRVSKSYRLGTFVDHPRLSEAVYGIGSMVASLFRASPSPPPESDAETDPELFWALKDVSFEVSEGEVFGIIGRNGSGKSTLLKILSRVTGATTGDFAIRGKLGSLLEVGTGFHPELTGKENIFLNGTILGMSQAEIRAKYDSIVEFSEISAFLNTPVKRYSSGMYIRLAFSIAVHYESDITILDEVLAVGDADFRAKCYKKINEIVSSGRTILMVNHDTEIIRTMCNRACWLQSGRLVAVGNASEVVDKYIASSHDETHSQDYVI